MHRGQSRLEAPESELDETRNAISRSGGAATVFVAEVSVHSEMHLSVDDFVASAGRLDVVVAIAGINGVWAPIDDLQSEEWNMTISINLTGAYLTIHNCVPHLKACGGGSVVVVSSINGTRAFTTPGATAYTATKAAQVAMVKQLALELARHQSRINAICPGEIETSIDANTNLRHEEQTSIPVVWPDGQVPITGGRLGRAEDVASVIGFLVSDEARHMTGSPVWVDGGQGLLR